VRRARFSWILAPKHDIELRGKLRPASNMQRLPRRTGLTGSEPKATPADKHVTPSIADTNGRAGTRTFRFIIA
jgi:hypothetical protein